ncbi:alpha-L-glutamate ligase [uncultured Ferrimonas sp.]|uniref:ATP-grasp domain-containing protein n=1 Tax=uncultured Ferrimonas sp. TaxID=432640 RepID=UPI0026222614|nr:alpha-L-glutamate ligase [uncultured Ferrimonas sp.]
MKPIYVMHENPEWVVPLHQAFAELGVNANEWFVDTGAVALDQVPADAVYYNRMSASSHTRGHRFAPELTRMALTWLEQHHRTVVNGTDALYLEVCKVSQYAALERAGIRTPKTRAVVGEANLVAAAQDFDQWPLILKPNRGGKGLGVHKFDTLAALAAHLGSNSDEQPLDGIWLLQQYIEAAEPFITRCEYVGGEFIYAVDVSTEQGFELCPADVCSIGDSFCPVGEQPQNKFRINHGFAAEPIIKKHLQFLADSGIDVAGIEVIRAKDGTLYSYDVNTNTNYNSQAESEGGVALTGMMAIAKHLTQLAQQ